MSTSCLEVRGLTLDYYTAKGWHRAVKRVSLRVARGEVLGLMGESGCGKSSLAYQLLGYRQPNARRVAGEVLFGETDITTLSPRALQKLRGNRISFVPQNPTTALNPAMLVGEQIAEVLRRHTDFDPPRIRERIDELLTQVGLGNVATIYRRYPHRLSGGQQQRVAIAMSLACEPDLVVLDEPTTGLDVTIQRQIIELLKSLRAGRSMSMVYVTHDLPLLRQIADRVGVMHAGELVEVGSTEAIFQQPQHPYTVALLGSIPQLDTSAPVARHRTSASDAVLEARHLRLGYGMSSRWLAWQVRGASDVARDVSFSIGENETFALIGESGSGKSTIARALCGLVPPLSGEIVYRNKPLARSIKSRSATELREIQYIFQNPDASLNPRMRVGDILARPLDVLLHQRGAGIRAKLEKAITDVKLDVDYLDRFPSQLSGGERQRVAIARALIVEPSLLLCDEVLSALDVSVQAQVLDLLRDLRERTGTSMLFISHDLSVVRSLADRVGVLYHGDLVEVGTVEQIFTAPQHPYTARLLSMTMGTHASHIPAAVGLEPQSQRSMQTS